MFLWFKYKKYRGESTLLVQIVKTKLLNIAYISFTPKHIFVYCSSTCHKSEQSFSKLISFDEKAFNLYGICKLFLLNQYLFEPKQNVCYAKDFLTHSCYIVWTGFTIQNSMVKFSKKKKKMRENYTCCKGALHQFYYELWKDTSFYYKLWKDTLKTNCEWKETLSRLKINKFCFRLWFLLIT